MLDIKTALVGDDGSSRARLAVDWAVELATAARIELLVVGVAEAGGDVAADAVEMDLEHRIGEPARARGVSCACRGASGDPRRAVLAHIADVEAGLAIVGDTGHWTVLRPPLGSVAGYLVHHSPCPVVVVPGEGGPIDRGRMLVGLDGSPGSAAALQWAAGLAANVHGSIVAAYMYSPFDDSYPHPPQASAWHQRIEPSLRSAIDTVDEPSVTIDLRMQPGHRVEGLLDLADEIDASLLVVGARGHGGFHRLLLGGTALELLHHSSRPVAVVPSGR